MDPPANQEVTSDSVLASKDVPLQSIVFVNVMLEPEPAAAPLAITSHVSAATFPPDKLQLPVIVPDIALVGRFDRIAILAVPLTV